MELNERTQMQLKSLNEFYSQEDIDWFMDDVDALCKLEKIVLENVLLTRLEEDVFNNLIYYRVTERVDNMYRNVIDICKERNVTELFYTGFSISSAMKFLIKTYGVGK